MQNRFRIRRAGVNAWSKLCALLIQRLRCPIESLRQLRLHQRHPASHVSARSIPLPVIAGVVPLAAIVLENIWL
jgi:hypothetical protein